MRRPGLLVLLLLVVGVTASVVALASREGNTRFVAQQQDLLPVSAAALQRLILTTSDPRPGAGGNAMSARCVSDASGAALGNPWRCLVRYPRLPRIGYAVSVRSDRSIYGSGQPEGARRGTPLILSGCCVGAP